MSTHVVLKRFTDPGRGDTQAIVQNEAAAIVGVEMLDVPAPRLLGMSSDGAETDGAQTEARFTHGDYQHFNVLWSRGRLSALVDWSLSRIASPDVGHCRLNLAVLYSPEIAERLRRVYKSEAGRQTEPWWDIHQLLAYADDWLTFIPVQVAGRAPVDVREMTGRVEDLLVMALARL